MPPLKEALSGSNAATSFPRWCTCLVPAAVHDLVHGVRRQLGPVEPVALGDLHDHLGVIVQVIGLLPQAEHFPHEDPCSTRRGGQQTPGKERGRQKVQNLMNEHHTHDRSGRLRVRARAPGEMSPSRRDRVWRVGLRHLLGCLGPLFHVS